jgi:hypothetical protein
VAKGDVHVHQCLSKSLSINQQGAEVLDADTNMNVKGCKLTRRLWVHGVVQTVEVRTDTSNVQHRSGRIISRPIQRIRGYNHFCSC